MATNVMAPVDILRGVDGAFEVQLVGLDRTAVAYGPAVVRPHRTVRGRGVFDVVVVPSLGYDVEASLLANAGFVRWLRGQYERGADVASWCTGVFLVAEAGLLDGLRATTHWALARQFERRFGGVRLEIERMLIDEGRVVTAGGATTVYLLLAHLVQRYCGRESSARTARECLTDLRRPKQTAYSDGRAYGVHRDVMVQSVQRYIAEHLGAELSLDVLARQAGASTKTLSRRFKAATGLAPIGFVQVARVEAAKQALADSDRSFEEVTANVGYVDARAFRRLFKRVTGLSPRAYRGLFGAQAAE